MTKLQFFYFDVHHCILTHDWIIQNTGGREGILNIGYLESPLEHIQNDDYYPSMTDKLTHLVYAINKNHAFNDGNKRSSLALGAYFLKINGYDFIINIFVQKMENIAVLVADNVISKELLFEIIDSILYEDDYSEELKLKIYHAMSRITKL